MTTQKLKFGIIGAGSIAQSYAQAFDGCETAEVTAVADVRADAAQALAVKFKDCRNYDSYREMTERAELDAVVVCTPPVTHPDICVHLLKRNVHVLCEKPLSIDSASARRMINAAKESGAKFTMASKFRYVEDVARAKSLIASGILGEIVLFENAFTSRVNMSSRWNSDAETSGGGVLIDNGTHSVDLMRYFLGPLADVQVVEGKRSQGLAVEETVHIFVRSTSGVMGSIDLSWSINKELASYIKIYGTQGVISIGWKESKYHLSSSPEWVVFGKGYDKVQAFRSQIDNFARAIRGEEALLITPEDGLASVEVVEAAYASLGRQNQWTAVSGMPGSLVNSSNNDWMMEANSIA